MYAHFDILIPATREKSWDSGIFTTVLHHFFFFYQHCRHPRTEETNCFSFQNKCFSSFLLDAGFELLNIWGFSLLLLCV